MAGSKGKVYALIMAGGVGSRFWPLSRRDFPKQFLKFFGDESLLQMASGRLDGLIPPSARFVVTNEQYVAETSRQLPELPEENILAEPLSRNTAPCIAFSAARLAELDPEGVMLVLPADHLIQDVPGFHAAVASAIEAAREKGTLVTMGITPSFPSTGFGYIEFEPDRRRESVFEVVSFKEKPNVETAQSFLESGRYLWNSGMFAWRIDTILGEFERSLPELFAGFNGLSSADEGYTKAVADAFDASQSISIDYGIMENARHVKVVPCDIGWSDVGDWQAAYELSPKDDRGNASKGDVSLIDASGCFAYSSSRRVVLLGTSDIVVVDAGDTILVCDRAQAQRVKEAANKSEGN
jgi:mannose-1-phosphate guanylyltransferase